MAERAPRLEQWRDVGTSQENHPVIHLRIHLGAKLAKNPRDTKDVFMSSAMAVTTGKTAANVSV